MGRRAKSNPADDEAALERRLIAILEALASALKDRGHRIEQNIAVVHSERIRFWVYEPNRRTRVPLKRSDFGYQPGATRQELVPSGRLVLCANPNENSSTERRWPDKPGRPLEKQIDKIAADFETLAQRRKDRRAESERYKREFEELLQQAASRYRWDLEAEERPGRLRDMTADWRKAQQMTAFLNALDIHLGPRPSAAMATWLEWARGHVADLDPFSRERMAELEEHAGLLAVPKTGTPEPDEEEWRELGMLDKYL